MNDDINAYVPSLLNPRGVRKQNDDFSLTQNSFVSRCSLSLRRNSGLKLKASTQAHPINKENSQNINNYIANSSKATKTPQKKKTIDIDSLGLSAIEDLHTIGNNFDSGSLGFGVSDLVDSGILEPDCVITEGTVPIISVSSNTELDQTLVTSDSKSDSTIIYNVDLKPTISVSFSVNKCQSIDINTSKSNIKSVIFTQKDDSTLVDCEIREASKISTESDQDEMMSEPVFALKRSAVTVNLEIKKKKSSPETEENSKVLILNTSAVEKISHVIVQPPNYKLVRENNLGHSKINSVSKKKTVLDAVKSNGVVRKLRQKPIDSFFCKRSRVSEGRSGGSELPTVDALYNGDGEEMSRNLSVAEKSGRKSPFLTKRADNEGSNGPVKVSSPRKVGSPRLETSCSSPRGKADSPRSHTPRKNVESIQFSIPAKSVSTKRTGSAKVVPHHKIVAGTHFAVDAFSYGEIQNVKHYFLTHFHSDHYSGLKKSFSKMLFCSKITADLCTSRLGVSPKCIHVIKMDDTIRVDGVEVTAVEANHCPGAIMLVFTLPNGKTLLHTGDFRASPLMESYPIFWNKDIHTIYLDTTYCNPRYDFPTQEQSLEMALYILRQKKLALEKVGKKFSSVLIVCGTYTIGKEKFFLGMSRRVGCAVWACPEKDRVLQAVEGRSFGHAPPHSCQLHVVPMRDLTHEKLRAYLESLKGTFSEVVAFKPSGWENGKTASVEKDMVTIHGIPYSEHSSFSELIRFVKFLKPKQVVPTVDISGGVRAVQKYFPCPLVHKEEIHCQSRVTDFFSIQNQQQVSAVT